MTHCRYVVHTQSIEVLQDDAVVASMALARFCAIDGSLRDVAEKAMSNPSESFVVPSTSFARNAQPRNYARYATISL